jgi:hypothetical protein
MKLFRKKKRITQVQNETHQNPITGNFINIEGKQIKPIFNKKVIDEVAQTIINFPQSTKVETKYMCMQHTNRAVYLALKEGAGQLNVKFNYSQSDLFRLIDWKDYANVLNEVTIALGLTSSNPIINN